MSVQTFHEDIEAEIVASRRAEQRGSLKLIINADDLGYSTTVNESIFRLMRADIVTSASVMMNAPATAEAVRLASKFPNCSFGVHLNLTEFQPLQGANGLEILLSEDGHFKNNVRQAAFSTELLLAVFAEWCAQIERALSLGLRVSHIDSHHHVHTIPQLFVVTKLLQKRYNIKKVRATRNTFQRSEVISPTLRFKKFLWNFATRNIYRSRMADYFVSFADFYGILQESNRLEGVVELMCHPGNASFDQETKLLWSPWRGHLPLGAEFISYHDL